MRPPIPWLGSKRRLAATILAALPPHTCYVEPFAGSASILFARDCPAKVEVLNDSDRELMSFFRVLRHHPEELERQFDWALNSRALFDGARATDSDTLTDVQRAARFYLLLLQGFGKKPDSWFGVSTTHKHGVNVLRLPELLRATHRRLAWVVLECLPWQECLARYDRPHTVFYLDPPYLGLTGYRGARWTLEDYQDLREHLDRLRGRAVLTVNDHPELRRLFAGLPCEVLEARYRLSLQGHTQGRQLLIRSWRG